MSTPERSCVAIDLAARTWPTRDIRFPTTAIHPSSRSISRMQALLRWDNDREHYLLMHDTASKNPTRVNDRAAKRHVLTVGDHIAMGHIRMLVEETEERQRSATRIAPVAAPPITARVAMESVEELIKRSGDSAFQGQRKLADVIRRSRVPGDRIIAFFTRLQTMLRAGVPIYRGLEVLRDQEENLAFQVVLMDVANSVYGGRPLSVALDTHPTVFRSLVVSMVRSGETAGRLDESLVELSRVLESEQELSRRIARASFYPCLVVGISILLTFGLFKWVLPGLMQGFDRGVQLPFITRICLVGVHVVNSPLLLFLSLAVLGAAGYFAVRWLKTEAAKNRVEAVLSRLPLFGRLIAQVAQCRLARSLAAQISSGMNMVVALRVAGETTGTAAWRGHMAQASEDLKCGIPLSKALLLRKPPHSRLLITMLAAGEETGDIPTLLNYCARMLQNDVDMTLEAVLQIIEPVLIAGVGVVIGFILLASILPIYGMMHQG